jgi:hypothetical protein
VEEIFSLVMQKSNVRMDGFCGYGHHRGSSALPGVRALAKDAQWRARCQPENLIGMSDKLEIQHIPPVFDCKWAQ